MVAYVKLNHVCYAYTVQYLIGCSLTFAFWWNVGYKPIPYANSDSQVVVYVQYFIHPHVRKVQSTNSLLRDNFTSNMASHS